jgi:DivIVA domain-containing protein
MRKKGAARESGSEWSAPAGGRVSPLDVQQKEFHVTRVGVGYRMREVDEFLDQVTDTLSALIAENEQLRASGGGVPAASMPGAPAGEAANPTDRGAVDAFLQREKGFLQDLGGLVQAHAEELRSMIRAARSDAAIPMVAAEAERGAQREQQTEPVAEPEREAIEQPVAEAEDPEPTVEDLEGAPELEDVEGAPEPVTGAPDEDEGPEPAAITGVIADEPIRLEDPEPARSRRSDEREGDSLRELFWGEE